MNSKYKLPVLAAFIASGITVFTNNGFMPDKSILARLLMACLCAIVAPLLIMLIYFTSSFSSTKVISKKALWAILLHGHLKSTVDFKASKRELFAVVKHMHADAKYDADTLDWWVERCQSELLKLNPWLVDLHLRAPKTQAEVAWFLKDTEKHRGKIKIARAKPL